MTPRVSPPAPGRFARLLIHVGCLALTLVARPLAAAGFELKDGDKVLFLGDTHFEREVDYGRLEAVLTTRFADRQITFRNLSWAGDTPGGKARASFDWNKPESEWLKRVKEQVSLVKPTVAFLDYGMTAALEGGTNGAPQHAAALARLMAAVSEVSGQPVRFVLLGPLHPQTNPPDSPLHAALAAVNSATEALARENGATFVNTLELSRPLSMLRMVLYDNPVALNESGHAQLARRIVDSLTESKSDDSAATELLVAAIRKKNELFFHRWRPANWTYLFGFRKHEQGQNAGEMPKFDPLIAEWEGRIARLRGNATPPADLVAEVTRLTGPAARQPQHDPNFKEQPVPTFQASEGFEATLWAENPQLYKPIQMNWDNRGRLWIASSRVYPQIRPGQEQEDAVIVVEDTNGDGKADRSTVFAEGLLIPTGVLPDNRGGVYVAASHQLLHFTDTDGDGKADQRKIVLSSFGTEDTHHNLHTLRWGFDGHIYLNQSIYTHSHLETPFGVARLNSGGIWRMNPENLRMEVFTKGGCNPWGHHWDQYGNSFFTDGAGGKGIYHAMEGATYFTYSDMRREADSISPGNYPKFASLERVHSSNFPAEWQGNLITCDFRAHRVVRFGVKEVGSSFQTVELPDLLRSTNVTFRPIDLRFGPDGALYIADWSNPIIQHGEVDFRDPRRDHEHGRIWRVAFKAGPSAKAQDLTKLTDSELLDRTLSANGWEQEQARSTLRQRGMRVLAAAKSWLPAQRDPRAKLEAMWLHSAFEKPADDLLGQLTTSGDARLRTAAARQLSRP
jgi:glucose/arabinose dehydrogenase